MEHIHTKACLLMHQDLAIYTPCRSDGLDRNLRYMNGADLEMRLRTQDFRGLTLTCPHGRIPLVSGE